MRTEGVTMDINQIAQMAGVSRATVSRYLNDGYVSQEKRAVIKRVIDQTGYVPSRQAKTLRTGKTDVVGIIIPKINSASVSRMVAGITSVFNDTGFQILLANTDNDAEREVGFLRLFTERHQVDGVILIGTVFTPEHLAAIKALRVPIVILDQNLPGYPCVHQDDYDAMRDVAEIAVAHAKAPGYIGVLEDDVAAGKMRHQAFLSICADHGIEVPGELSGTVALHTSSWLDIADYLIPSSSLKHREAEVIRNTKETEIKLSVDIDGTGDGHIVSGIGFFDHMLDQIVRHSRFDIDGVVKGDLQVDEHHSVEDTALALGEAVRKALGEKRGIERYGYEVLMMDDVVATCSIDFSGRPEFIWDVEFTMEYIGQFPSELVKHFFRSFSSSAECNLYLSATRAGNNHHTAEALFKAFARAMRKAVRRIPGESRVSSTKGVL